MFLTKILFFNKIQSYFSVLILFFKRFSKNIESICTLLTWRLCRKLKLCVTLLIFKMNNLHICLSEVAGREVIFRFHLLSRQDRKQYCIHKLNFCFHPTFLPFSCVSFFYIYYFEKLLHHYFIWGIYFAFNFQALTQMHLLEITSYKAK